MTKRVAEATGAFLEKQTSRRGFLARVGVLGAAFAAGPIRLLTRPDAALALQPGDCPSGSRCGSHYTEFCCSITGANACPHGTFVGGWWKAHAPTGSAFCNGGKRFILDCNKFHKSDCPYGSHCYNGTCNCYGTCVNRFSYRNCNVRYQKGRSSWVVCRMVMCSNPCRARVGASRTQPGGHCRCKGVFDDATRYHSPCKPGQCP
jgi:hypothetical protein